MDLGSIINQTSKETHGSLVVEKRILRAGDRVINLSNVSSVAVVDERASGRATWWVLAVILTVAGVFLMAANTAGIVLLLLAVGAAFMALRIRDRHFLLIQTNDGFRAYFANEDKAFLQQALDFVARKINEADQGATGAINFEAGSIGALTMHADTIAQTAETIVAGTGHTVVARSTGVAIGERNVVGDRNLVGQRLHVEETRTQQSIAFGALTEDVSKIREALSQTGQFDPAIIAKIDEMHALMRAGAARPEERQRMAAIAREVCGYLQAYPSVVQVFSQVGDLVAKAL